MLEIGQKIVYVSVFTIATVILQCSLTIAQPGPRRKFIIDAEPGLDDAVAIVTALGRANVEILAVTCPNGNTIPEQAAFNAMRILSAAGRSDIPVFRGSALPLMGEYHYTGPDFYFGKDAFGDANYSDEILNMSLIRPEIAPIAMVNFVNNNPGEVTIVAIGPLTNIALAIRLDPSFVNKTKEIHIMGGSPTARGSIGPVTEFNFGWDPAAALIVLAEMQCPIYLITKDVCDKNRITSEQRHNLFSGDSKLATFLRKIHKNFEEHDSIGKMYSLCDSLCMTHAINSSLATKTEALFATVELCGEHTRGQMIADRSNIYHFKPNVNIVQDVDLNEVLSVIRAGIVST